MSDIDSNLRQLAAVAFGEAGTSNNSEEMGSIAFAVANRARAWNGKTVEELFQADKNYAYAITDGNARYQLFMATGEAEIQKSPAMKLALEWAKKALANETPDPSNGAFWWDGTDIKKNYSDHDKVKKGIYFSKPEHNIFDIKNSSPGTITIYWKVRDKKTGREISSKIRGSYDYIYLSTAAYGSSIFWKYNPDFIVATGAKEYK